MWRRVAMVCLALTVVSSCVGPSRSLGDYREKAANAAEAMRSAVETARLVVEADADGRSLARYTSLVLSESEDAASSIAQSFAVVQPPGGRAALDLRERASTVFETVTSTLSDLRIAARAGRHRDLPRLAQALPVLSEQLLGLTELTAT